MNILRNFFGLFCITSLMLISSCCKHVSKSLHSVQNCCAELETIPISKLIKNKAHYWKIDSLGSNGYRRESSPSLSRTKVYDVNYDYVKSKFGEGMRNETSDTDEFTFIKYCIFDTNFMGKGWEDYHIMDILVFKFDNKSKKLVSVFVSGKE